MIRRMVCIECPEGCELSVAVAAGKADSITGNKCPRGKTYAAAETENPVRILTSTVAAEGMDLRRVPVRTREPVPRKSLMKAMKEIRGVKLSRPAKAGDIILRNIAGSGTDLIATRGCGKGPAIGE